MSDATLIENAQNNGGIYASNITAFGNVNFGLKRLAILIDEDNLWIGQKKSSGRFSEFNIIDFCKRNLGIPTIAKVYIKGRYVRAANLKLYRDTEIDVVLVPNDGKDAADKMMICDALEILHVNDSITTFVIVTGDKDLAYLVQKLFKLGKEVVVIGPNGATSTFLKQVISSLNQKLYYFSEVA
jgi:uncharacterized protein (TIGR00288 family)